jgi:hypothetical protein
MFFKKTNPVPFIFLKNSLIAWELLLLYLSNSFQSRRFLIVFATLNVCLAMIVGARKLFGQTCMSIIACGLSMTIVVSMIQLLNGPYHFVDGLHQFGILELEQRPCVIDSPSLSLQSVQLFKWMNEFYIEWDCKTLNGGRLL